MTSNKRTELKEQKGFATVLEERKPPQASGKVRREGANGRSLGARQEESNPSTPAKRANGRRHPAKCTPLHQQSEQFQQQKVMIQKVMTSNNRTTEDDDSEDDDFEQQKELKELNRKGSQQSGSLGS